MRSFLAAIILLASAGYIFAQQTGGGGVPGAGGGGGGTPSGPAGGVLSGTYPNPGVAALIPVLQNVQYLSCASDLGAQINAAVTALSNVGVIQLPNCTNATMTTTATNIPPGISIRGYGKLASIVNCTVAGDCFQFLMNPTTAGEIGSTISDFAINPSGASGQTLMHFNGASGYTLHDLQFAPYATGAAAAACLEFDNSASGLFTEGNRSYNVSLERTCTIGVLFHQSSSDGSTSFAYNFFEFHVVSSGANFAVKFDGGGGAGGAQLYGGSMAIYGNHALTGAGGIVYFTGNFSTDISLGLPTETLFVSAEENGSGGTLIKADAGSTIRTFASIVNGAPNGGGSKFSTVYNINASATWAPYTAVLQNTTGQLVNPHTVGILSVEPNSAGFTDGKLNLVPFGTTTPTYTLESSNGGNIFEFTQAGTGAGASTIPFLFYGAPFAGLSSQVGTQIPDAGCYQFGDGASFVVDAQICRTAAGAINVRTPGSATGGQVQAGSVKPTVYTVSTLPSAATLGAGAMVSVSDGAGTPPTCTGSGSNYQVALSNGSTWTCH